MKLFRKRERVEPPIRRGLIGFDRLPVGSRLFSIAHVGLFISFSDFRVESVDTVDNYGVAIIAADGTKVSAPHGARITWEARA